MVPDRSAIMRARFALSHRESMTDKKLDTADLAAITGRTLNHYDRFAESFWEGTRDHDVSQNIDALLQHIGADPPFTLLDFGCGPGRDLKVFIERGHMAIGLEGSARLAQAQTYPTRPVRIVVGFPPGGPGDILARLTGQWLSERLGHPFIIENRPRAGANVATQAVVNASPDGYTLLLVNAANAINATLYEKLKYDFIRDIVPVAGIMRVPLVLEVNPSLPVKTVPELIAYAKANPAKLNMASAGNGTPQHVSGELFKMMAGVNMTHVPYRGSAPALADLLGGQVQVMFDTMPASIEYLR